MASGWWKSTYTNLALGSPVDFTVTTGPGAPRGYPKLASIATGAGLFLGGTPCVAIDDVIYYAGDSYTQDTDDPILLRYDGRIATTVLEIPPVVATPAKAILSLAKDDDGNIFISTWDSGTLSTTFAGRVFVYSNGVLTQIDEGLFTAGKLPYALVSFNNMLYVGVTNQNPATATNLYAIDYKTTRSGGPVPTATPATVSWYYQVSSTKGSPGWSTLVSGANDPTLDASVKNTISWNADPAVTGAGYAVYRATSATGDATFLGFTLSLSMNDTGGGSDAGFALPHALNDWGASALVSPVRPASTCTYKIGAVVDGIEYISAAGTTSQARSTLTASSKVVVSWSAVPNASSYKVYRTAGHSSTGLIGTTTSLTLDDTGLAGTGSVPVASTSILAPVSGATGCMIQYGSDLYVGAYQASGTFASVYKVTTSNVVSTSNTIAPGGSAGSYNGFTAAIVFDGNLYMAYWNDDATDIALIRKYTGSAWSTVKTISGAGARPMVAFAEVDGKLWVYGGGDAKTGILYQSSTDGATWTDQSALLPSSKEAIPFMASANVLGGF